MAGYGQITPKRLLKEVEEDIDWLNKASVVQKERLLFGIICIKMAGYDRIAPKRLLEEVHEDIDWLNKASVAQKDQLKVFLLNLDKPNRTNMDTERSKTISQGVNQIIHTISKKMEERLPAFRGKLVPMGSSHNGTKIGQPDEYDFVQEMDGVKLLTSIGKFGRLKSSSFGRGTIEFDDGTSSMDDELREHYLVLDNNSRVYLETPGTTLLRVSCGDVRLSSPEIICNMFDVNLKEVLAELELPSGWYHGGFNRPNFSGLRISGPAYLLQFDYLTKDDEDHLRLSIDFVPMVTVHIPEDLKKDRLHTVLKDLHLPDFLWVPIVNTKFPGYYESGSGEEEWLAQYSVDSISKTLIRVFKIVNGLVKLTSSKCLTTENAKDIADIIKQKKQGYNIKPADLPDLVIWSLPHSHFMEPYDDYARYSDLGEIAGHASLFASHDIKTLVMAMMAVDESRGHAWTEDDLPELVMSFYMFITNKMKKSVRFESTYDIPTHVSGKTFSVPLNSLLLTNIPHSSPTRDEKPLSKPKLEASEFVTSMESLSGICFTSMGSKILNTVRVLIDDGYSYVVISAIARLFRVFRCVCEGEDTVHITPIRPRNMVIDNVLITKRELEEMLMDEHHVVPGTPVTVNE